MVYLMIVLKNYSEIEKMRVSGRIVAEILDALEAAIKPGISTWDLEVIADSMSQKADARPAFKNYRVGKNIFPCCLCISINEEVVHGIPSKTRILQEGDIASIDCGVQKNGYYGDSARTFAVGQIDAQSEMLLQVTRQALALGIAQMKPEYRLQDIGAAIQQHVEQHGFSVVRDFVGHGIGRKLHEDPQIPNFGVHGRGIKLHNGMIFAIEPMVNIGFSDVEILPDGWTVVTCDRQRSAHFEHTIAITDHGPDILTLAS
jgi:methionyl aminopeptidase